MLKRAPSLTDQVKAHIKQQILSDEFEDGRIPAETDLANQLGVSRTTIRDALSRLEIEGAIFRKQGVGTFVNKAGLRIKMRLEEIGPTNRSWKRMTTPHPRPSWRCKSTRPGSIWPPS